jgi:hypothetical protein
MGSLGDLITRGRASTDKLLKNHDCRGSRHNGGHKPLSPLILLMFFPTQHSPREGLVSQRTGIINQIRASLLERIVVRQAQRLFPPQRAPIHYRAC